MARKHLDRSETRPLEITREVRALRKDIENIDVELTDNEVTFAKLQDIATDRLIGRDTAGLGDPEEIALSAGLEFSGAGSIRLADNGASNAKLADMAASTIKGRATASLGDPEDLSLASLTAEASPAPGDFVLGWESGGALRKFDLGVVGLPPGGTSGQTLIKQSSTDGDADWVTPDSFTSGTFTPVLAGATTAGSHTYAVNGQLGRYWTIGPIVYYSTYIELTAKGGTMAGFVKITGLPFAARNLTNEFMVTNMVIANIDLAGADRVPYATTSPNTTELILGQQGDNIAQAVIDSAAIANNSRLFIAGFYFRS